MSYAYERVSQSEYNDADLDETLQQVQAELREKEYQRSQAEADLDEDAIFPNHIVETEQLIVNGDFIDRASFTASQRKALRSSILDAEVIKAMTDQEAERASSKNAAMKQVLLFIMAIVVNSMASTLDEWAVTDPLTGRRVTKHIKRMPSFVSYLISTIFASVTSPLLYSRADLQSLWNPIAIMKYMPVAVAYCINDVVAFNVMAQLGGSPWKVLTQSKLMMTAVGAWLFLRRDLTATQWLLLVTTSLSILSYSMQGLSNMEVKNLNALFMGIGTLLLTTAAGLMCEVALKKEKGHFIVQFGRTRICGFLAGIPLLLYEVNRAEQWHLFPFGGWRAATLLLVFDDICRCWATTLIVKQLDSVWKTLAGALSLNLTYMLNIWMNPANNSFDFGQFTIITAIAVDIVAFASSKQDEQKILQLAADIERKNKSAA